MKKRSNNGKAPDDLAALFAALKTAPAASASAAADEAGRAAVLAGLSDGSLFAPGVENLNRLGQAIASGWLDDADLVSDATRRQVIDFVAERLRDGGVAEKIAAAGAWDAIMSRPGVRARPEAAGGPAPLHSEDNGDAPGADPRPPGGRTKRGRFAAGNHCARGNPAHRKAAALRAALGRELGEAEMQALGKKLYEQALAGDTTAARLLLEYVVGRPRLAPDADLLDAHEFAVLSAGPSLARLWLGVHEAVDPQFACSIWRKLSASDPDAATTQLVNAVEAEPQRFARDLDRVRARAAAAGG
jgi:hypothetical protein